jgi:hypothetical protein
LLRQQQRRLVPDQTEILAGLTLIANRAVLAAILWHVALAALGCALLLGWRPSQRMLALGLSAPLASVSLCAWYYGNPFNALTFGAGTIGATVLAYRSPPLPLVAATDAARAVGALLLAFGWTYPHFLESPAIRYLYAAPLGIIPCPTLSVVIGIALLGNGLVGGAWRLLLAAFGVFYAVFGAVRLGVTIDLVLLAGALGLLAQTRHARAKPV